MCNFAQIEVGRSYFINYITVDHNRVLARIPKLAVQKFFWEWPNICVGMVALKVFWDVNRNCSYKTHALER